MTTKTTPPQPLSQAVDYQTCEQCGAPVDAAQRYCVVCGIRRKHVHDPAARFLSGASARARTAAPQTGTPKRRSAGLATALGIALIPLALGAGVILGHAGNGTDSKLLAALKAQKPEVIDVGGAGTNAAGPAISQASTLTSDFPLQRGYTVELSTLPAGTSQTTATEAERQARAQGAGGVGLISQADYKITPAPPTGDYVIYSGQFQKQLAARQALVKLKKAFPGAKVIAVEAGGPGNSTPVLNTTSYGSFHAVAASKPPTQAQLNQGAQVAKQVAGKINSNYVDSQKGLPNQVSIP